MGGFQDCCCRNNEKNEEIDIQTEENNKKTTTEIIAHQRKMNNIELQHINFKSSIYRNCLSDSESALNIFDKEIALDENKNNNLEVKEIDNDKVSLSYAENNMYEPSNISLSIKETKNFFTVVRMENSKENNEKKNMLKKMYTKPNFMKSSKNTPHLKINEKEYQNGIDYDVDKNKLPNGNNEEVENGITTYLDRLDTNNNDINIKTTVEIEEKYLFKLNNPYSDILNPQIKQVYQ